jgi:hypothetical protein
VSRWSENREYFRRELTILERALPALHALITLLVPKSAVLSNRSTAESLATEPSIVGFGETASPDLQDDLLRETRQSKRAFYFVIASALVSERCHWRNTVENIHFDEPFYIDPVTLQPAASGIPLPTYGNFGGAGYSQGVFVLNPDPTQFDPVPIDSLDQLFQVHDQAYTAGATPNDLSVADVALIRGIAALDQSQLDPEASLYGGAATLAVIEHLEETDSLGLITQEELVGTTTEALQNIERGFAGLSTGEIFETINWLNDVTNATALESADAASGLSIDSAGLQAPEYDWSFI